MKLNVKKALDAEEERKNRVKPLPRIVIGDKLKVNRPQSTVRNQEEDVIEIEEPAMDRALSSVEIEIRALKVHKAKLSNQIGPLINEVAQQLKKEGGQALADEFLNGNLCMQEIKEHYAKIQKVQYEIMRLMDGTSPRPSPSGEGVMQEESHEVSAVKYEIRRLDDLIYKLCKKMDKANGGIKKPKNSDRVILWRTQRAQAEARRIDLKVKLKGLRHGS